MRGTYHLTLSLLVGITVFFPILVLDPDGFLPLFMSLTFILAIIWGSLVPDIDASDSILFHEYPYVAKFFKFMIYSPLTIILKEKKHRGFMHSVEGIFLTVGIFMGYIFIGVALGVGISLFALPSLIDSILSSFESMENIKIDVTYVIAFLIVISFGLGLGMFFHIFEDSLTVSGINWRWYGDNSWHRKGNIRVGGIYEHILVGIITVEAAIFFILQYQFNTDLPIQIMISFLAFAVFIGTGFFSQSQLASKLFHTALGEDKKVLEVRSRNKAKKEALKVNLDKNLLIYVDPGRIKRGISIPKSEINLKTKIVQKYTITEEDGIFSCSCKDFKNVGNLVSCKHIVALLSKKDPKFRNKFTKLTN